VYVEALLLEAFRNYTKAEVNPSTGLTLVVGENAQGKTNLLEAFYCLSGFGSPRSADANLVMAGAEKAFLHGKAVRGERRLEIDLEMRAGRGVRALLNKTPLPGPRALSEVLAAVFFGPDDLSLIKGSPGGRRRFADDLAVKLRPARDGIRREWERVLKQRNALLKSAPRSMSSGSGSTLDVWDESFCRTGAALAAARLDVLSRLRPLVLDRYSAIADTDGMDIGYESAWVRDDLIQAVRDGRQVEEKDLQGCLADALEESRGRELERGMSIVGPQRDDLQLWIVKSDGSRLDARTFASQGEQRSAALALKLAEYELLSDVHGERPILLLDDVFSELDPSRRRMLSDAVRAEGQVVMTSAEPGAAEAARAGVVLEVTGGEVSVRAG
jgi:DNA replication and repair protein RecF